MKRWILTAVAGIALFGVCAAHLQAGGRSVLHARIVGDSVLVPIRGIAAAGNPWIADNSKIKLEEDGDLDVRIRGLVIAPGITQGGTMVNPAFVGTNPVRTVRIAVTWMVPNPAAPVFIQETVPLTLDVNGDLFFRGNIGTPPAGAERPIALVRAGATPLTGPYIGCSDFLADFGSTAGGNHGSD